MARRSFTPEEWEGHRLPPVGPAPFLGEMSPQDSSLRAPVWRVCCEGTSLALVTELSMGEEVRDEVWYVRLNSAGTLLRYCLGFQLEGSVVSPRPYVCSVGRTWAPESCGIASNSRGMSRGRAAEQAVLGHTGVAGGLWLGAERGRLGRCHTHQNIGRLSVLAVSLHC